MHITLFDLLNVGVACCNILLLSLDVIVVFDGVFHLLAIQTPHCQLTDMSADESMVFDTPPFNEDTQYRAPQGLAARRVYKVGKWTPSETLILVQCKQMNREKYSLGGNKRTLMTSAIERYSAMEEEMVKRGVMRSKNQIQEKWEQLGADFKKVYDYEKHIPSGRPSYFQMSPQERKQSTRRKFPKAALDEGVFKALCEWFPIKLQSLDSDNLPIESSAMPNSSGKNSNLNTNITQIMLVSTGMLVSCCSY